MIVGVRGVEDTRGTWPTESTKQGSWVLTETEAATTESSQAFTWPSVCTVGI